MSSSSCRRFVASSYSPISCLIQPVYRVSSSVAGSNTIRQCQLQFHGRRFFSAVHDVPTPYPTSSSRDTNISSQPPPAPPSSNSSPFYSSLGSSSSGESAQSPLRYALNATGPRMDWTREEIGAIYETPLMELAYAAVGLYLFRA